MLGQQVQARTSSSNLVGDTLVGPTLGGTLNSMGMTIENLHNLAGKMEEIVLGPQKNAEASLATTPGTVAYAGHLNNLLYRLVERLTNVANAL